MTRSGRTTPTARRYSGLDAPERTRRRRAAILSAALELFGTQGYAATSIKQVCREAELTERYFYESFRDRHDLLVVLYADLADQMRTAVTDVLANPGSPGIDDIAGDSLSAFIDFLTVDPRRARVILVEVVGVSSDLEARRLGVLRGFAETTRAVWLGASERDQPTEAQRLATIGLVGAVNHMLVDWLLGGRRESPEALVDTCSALFSAARERFGG